MLYSKIFTKLAVSTLTLSLLVACGGNTDNPTQKTDNPTQDTTTTSMTLSGSVGDGPIVGATITLEDAKGEKWGIPDSDSTATYQASLQLRDDQYPLIIKAEDGTDLVTNTTPDFTLYSVVLSSSSQEERISNINPHSTLITKTAQNLPDGVTSENISTAQEVVLRIFNFGLDLSLVPDPIVSEITIENTANISKSSEVLGEVIRRTRDVLMSTGANFSGNDVVDAISADLVDGKLDGLGVEGANKAVAAIVSLVSGQVLLEASANRLRVNNSIATGAMDAAIAETRPNTTIFTGDVMITATMLEQIKSLVNSAASIAPSPMLSNIIDKLASISGEQHPDKFSTLFPVEVSGGFSSIIQHASQATESELDAINNAINLQTKPNDPGRFEFGAANYSINENGGMVEITINRLGGSSGAVTIDWMTAGVTATFAQDYGNFNWTPLAFADGETSKVETISIVNDSLVEENEVFNVLLGNPTGGATVGTVATTAVTIINDDTAPEPQPGRFEFGAASYSIDENGGMVEITINRLGGSDGAVTIDWMTAGVTATFAQDYGNFNWTPLAFADGETSKVETISIVNDSLVEEDEVFNVLLGNPTGGATVGTVATTAVTIVNDDSNTPAFLSILSTTPPSQAYTVQLSENIVIEFDDTLECQTVNSQTIFLVGNSGDIPTLISCVNSTVTLDPENNLTASTAYTVTALSSVASTSGNTMEDNYSWTFTTLAGQALPMLSEWESKMLADGEYWGQYLTNLYPPAGTFSEQTMTYYDSQRVFYQIAEYTGQDEPWHSYALEAKRVYLNYVENSVNDSAGYNFSFPGYRRFAQGIYMEYVLTGDSKVYENIAKIRDNPAISEAGDRSISVPAWYWERRSREVAYALEAHIFAERAGYPRDEADVARYVSMALNHIKEWTSGEFGYTESYRRAPFMFALTAEALIIFYEWELENGRDPSALYNHSSVPAEFIPTIGIPEAIKSMADYLYDEAVVISGENIGKRMWVEDLGGRRPNWNDEGGSGYSTFRYEDIKSGAPTIDLNLLIAPAYAWLFQHYGDMKYINIADRLFTSGVSLSNTRWNTKIFNQNYRWSFDYVKWRNEGFAKIN